MTPLEQAATELLVLLAKLRKRSESDSEIDGPTLAKLTQLPSQDINDAIALLEGAGYIEWQQFIGTAPYDFGLVWITPRGRYEAERISGVLAEPLDISNARPGDNRDGQRDMVLPPAPIGSPFGFSDEDWEVIAKRKGHSDVLTVVLGYQFSSTHYDPARLRDNVRLMFDHALTSYNAMPGALKATLSFRPLAAGYGEHLFNEIARDIIGADIAVFDTSDLNPNVMLELGVALTWGVRVLPIKLQSRPKPPSDISGQTWADYADSAASFDDPEHEDKLVRMVERAMRKKPRAQ
jgi:hypothetical protein